MRNILKILLALSLLADAGIGAASAQTGGGSPAPQPPAASENTLIIGRDVLTHIGKKELDAVAEDWWNWYMPQANGANSLDDDCSQNQEGAIWYLSPFAENYSETAVSSISCAVPYGKYMVLPLAAGLKWGRSEPEDRSAKAERKYCLPVQKELRKLLDKVDKITLEIDGKHLKSFKMLRGTVKTCLMDYYEETAEYAADGYWAVLPPLSKGHHIIRFSSSTQGKANGDDYEIVLPNAEYQIDVQ